MHLAKQPEKLFKTLVVKHKCGIIAAVVCTYRMHLRLVRDHQNALKLLALSVRAVVIVYPH
jgi:prolyl-tRNA editing enzyme YbaK/EbsC (Cys-tRNA(Pro) deacylase)